MLFGYPVTATHNNWLHDCLTTTIRDLHAKVDAGEGTPPWPDILPLEHRTHLVPRRGLRDRISTYDIALRQLSKADRDSVLQALEAENRIADLLSGACECATIDGLPEAMREPAKNLFGFAFELLTDLQVRDQLYAAVYSAAQEHTCPFCGTEYFDAPGGAREALDHYLAKGRYPFAAANLRNLVPMGTKCNSRYKLAIDLLRDAKGARRVAFDPYNHSSPIKVLLDASIPFAGDDAMTPKWEIQFDPDSPAASTWDEVFSLRERYRRDHLDPSFPALLTLFRKWARTANITAPTDIALIEALRTQEESWGMQGYQDRAFLKAAVFRMLRVHCESGNARLLQVIRDLVAPPTAPSALQ